LSPEIHRAIVKRRQYVVARCLIGGTGFSRWLSLLRYRRVLRTIKRGKGWKSGWPLDQVIGVARDRFFLGWGRRWFLYKW
jgi:hypothetical protein